MTGFESRSMTGEPSARDSYEPMNMQAISWCFAIDHLEGEDHVIDKPSEYDFWRSYVPDLKPSWGNPLLSWSAPDPCTLKSIEREFLPNCQRFNGHTNLWTFRRILDRTNFTEGKYLRRERRSVDAAMHNVGVGQGRLIHLKEHLPEHAGIDCKA
jgi:hypothetical protein